MVCRWPVVDNVSVVYKFWPQKIKATIYIFNKIFSKENLLFNLSSFFFLNIQKKFLKKNWSEKKTNLRCFFVFFFFFEYTHQSLIFVSLKISVCGFLRCTLIWISKNKSNSYCVKKEFALRPLVWLQRN